MYSKKICFNWQNVQLTQDKFLDKNVRLILTTIFLGPIKYVFDAGKKFV